MQRKLTAINLMSYRAITRGNRQQVHGQISSRYEANVINALHIFLVIEWVRHLLSCRGKSASDKI